MNLLSRFINFDIQGVAVEKVDKFHHYWQMYLLNLTISPYVYVYVYEIHFLIASDNFILTRAKKHTTKGHFYGRVAY